MVGSSISISRNIAFVFAMGSVSGSLLRVTRVLFGKKDGLVGFVSPGEGFRDARASDLIESTVRSG